MKLNSLVLASITFASLTMSSICRADSFDASTIAHELGHNLGALNTDVVFRIEPEKIIGQGGDRAYGRIWFTSVCNDGTGAVYYSFDSSGAPMLDKPLILSVKVLNSCGENVVERHMTGTLSDFKNVTVGSSRQVKGSGEVAVTTCLCTHL